MHFLKNITFPCCIFALIFLHFSSPIFPRCICCIFLIFQFLNAGCLFLEWIVYNSFHFVKHFWLEIFVLTPATGIFLGALSRRRIWQLLHSQLQPVVKRSWIFPAISWVFEKRVVFITPCAHKFLISWSSCNCIPEVGISIMIKLPQTEMPGAFSFVKPMQGAVWSAALGALLAVAIVLLLVQRKPHNESIFSFQNTLWFTIASIFRQSTPASPRFESERFL